MRQARNCERRLDHLEERSVRLDEASANFRSGAYVLKRQAWWQNAKFKAVGVSALVIILFVHITFITINIPKFGC